MASDVSTSDGAGLTSTVTAKDDVVTTSSTQMSQLQQQGNETEGSMVLSEDKKDETNTAVTVSAVTTTAVPTNAASKPQDGVMKSPTVSKKPHVVSPLLRFPLRIGITWKKGERLEAMDFSKTWYPSKIVELDENAKTVLIHFDGWNSRYDEWVPMNSDKLRPQTRHSERKEKKSKNFPQPCAIQDIYNPGEGVLARWTDCKKYPAKISRLMSDGTFEVVFYDGLTRNVQPINIQPLPEELKNAADKIQLPSTASAGSLPVAKLSFKSIELELPEGVVKRKKSETYVVKKLSGVEKRNRHMEKSIKKSLAHISGSFKKSPLKAHRMKNLKGSSKKTFKKLSSSSSSSSSSTSLSSSSCTSSPSLSTSSSSSSLAPLSSSTSDMGTVAPGASVVSSSSTTGNLKMVLKIGHSPIKDSSTQESTVTSTVVVQTPPPPPPPMPTLPTGVKRVKKRSNTDPAHYPRRKRKKKSKEPGLVPKGPKGSPRKRGYSLDLGATPTSSIGGVGFTTSPVVPSPSSSSITGASPRTPVGVTPQPEYFVPSKAFVVEEDHNPFKCPFDGCTKEFRKENLLTSHIKHYHDNLVVTPAIPSSTASGTGIAIGNAVSSSSSSVTSVTAQPTASPLPSLPGQFSPSVATSPHLTPLLSPASSQTSLQQQPVVPVRRRRRKTGSFCSTDSDVSVSSRGRSSSSKRQRHDSEISVTGSPDILSRDLWADVKLKAPQDLLAEEYGETEEEDVETDLVNCICQLRETNGLMIQCDVCMCWQHFTCVDTEGTGRPPTNYVCLACERPKGVRDSCKYIHDMGWERRGELPTFPYLGETVGKNTERMKCVASECIPLSSALMDMKAVLHSTRRQIKISKEEDEPEFQLWQTDWDNWTKPEEDLTLTPPRSVEAAPSPAPSTFMFPPAPGSPPMLPAGTPLTGNQQPETSPGLENLPPSSISMVQSAYQDNFKSWLSTAKGGPQKSSSSSSSSTCLTSSTSSSSSVEAGKTQLTFTTLKHPSKPNHNSSTECSNVTPPPSSTTAISSTVTDDTSLSSSSSVVRQQQEQQEICQSNSLAPPSKDSNQDPHQQSSESALPPLSLDTQSEQLRDQQMISPQLTPPMNATQHQQALSAALSQTPSSARSCSRISTISSLPTVAADGRICDRNDIVRGDLFTPGPGGDASSLPGQPQIHQDASHTNPAPGGNESDHQRNSNPAALGQQSQSLTTHSSSNDMTSLTSSNKIVSDAELHGQAHHTAGSLPTSHGRSSSPEGRNGNNSVEGVGRKELGGRNSDDDEGDVDVGSERLSEEGGGRRRKSSSISEQFHQPLRELYIDVNGGSGGDAETVDNVNEADDDNDTDTAEESVEPYRDCERNLLVHISRTHSVIENQLEEFEKQIEELEALADQNDSNLQLSGENVLNDVPALKKSLGKLNRSLGKIQTLSMYR